MNSSPESSASLTPSRREPSLDGRPDLSGSRLTWVRVGLVVAALLVALDTFQPTFSQLVPPPHAVPFAGDYGWEIGVPFTVSSYDFDYTPQLLVKLAASLWLTFAVWCAAAACAIVVVSRRDLVGARRTAGALLLWHAGWVLWTCQFWEYHAGFGRFFNMFQPEASFYILMQTLALGLWPVLLLRLMLPAAADSSKSLRSRDAWLALGYVATMALVIPIGNAAVQTSYSDAFLTLGGPVSGVFIAAAPLGWLAFAAARRLGASKRTGHVFAAAAALPLAGLFYYFSHSANLYWAPGGLLIWVVQHVMIVAGIALGGLALLRGWTPFEIAPLQAAPASIAPPVVARPSNDRPDVDSTTIDRRATTLNETQSPTPSLATL